MCGIVGVVSLRPTGLWRSEAECFKDLLVVDVVRGADATGIAWMDSKDTVWTLKQAVPAHELADDIELDELANSRFIIGHNRAATIGAADDHEKAHPFSVNGVTGVHNGTLRSWRYDLRDLATKAEMDSEAVIEALSNTPEAAADVGNLLGQKVGAGGAYSLVWYDERVRALRFARNADRPMSFVVTPGAIWYASERMMLEWVLTRNKIVMKEGWFTQAKQLVTLPLDGKPAQLHSYQNVYPRYTAASLGRGYYSTVANDYSRPGPYMGHGYRSSAQYLLGPSDSELDLWNTPTCLGPDQITLHTAQYLPGTLSELSSLERGAIYRQAEQLLGGALYSQKLGTNVTIGELMAANFENHKEVDVNDRTAYVDFTVCDVFIPVELRGSAAVNKDDTTFVGYVTRDGVKYPAIMRGEDVEQETAIAIQTLALDQGRFAHVPWCAVEGLRIYHTGKMAYVLADCLVDPYVQIKVGAAKQGNTVSVHSTNEFVWRHPEVMRGVSTIKGRVSWHYWTPAPATH